MTKLSILHHSNYLPEKDGHGGSKRTAQLLEILANNDLSYTSLAIDLKKSWRHLSWSRKISLFLGSVLKFAFLGKNISLKRMRRQDRLRFISKNILKQLPSIPDIFIWESTLEIHQFIASELKSKGVKILGITHNLESLVPSDTQYGTIVTNESLPKRFEQEITTLSICDEVFVISREEQWLLNLFEVKANFLPYYPILETKNGLIEIRKNREGKTRSNEFLILGTVLNPPTLAGTISLITMISKTAYTATIHIAGYGTENLKSSLPDHSLIKLHGDVTPTALNTLLEKVDAILIGQPYTTGALTKIPEMLIAGIPVICNEAAARSFYDCAGVYLFHDETDLSILLNKSLDTPPVPLEEKIYSDYFIKALETKLGKE